MKILEKQRTANTVTLTLEIPEEHYRKALDEELREASHQIHVPGFRKGKAPADVVKRHVNEEFIADRAVRTMTSHLYPQIVKEATIEPVDYPRVTLKEKSDGKPLTVEIAVDVYPEVKLGKYKGLKVDALPEDVTADEVETHITNYRERQAKLDEVKDRAIQENDFVEMGIETVLDGKPFPPLTQMSWAYQVGSQMLTGAFDQQLIGVNLGEQKKFPVTFPVTFDDEELREKTAEFSIIVKRVVERKLPEADDEFAKKVGPYETVQALRDDIRSKLEAQKKDHGEDHVRNSLVAAVTEEAKLELPDGLVRREMDIMLNELARSLETNRLTFKDYLSATQKTEESIRDEMKPAAASRAKAKVVLRAIASEEKIEVTDEDLNKEYEALVQGSNRSAADFKASLGEDGIEYIKDYLLRRKALDFIVEKAKISKSPKP